MGLRFHYFASVDVAETTNIFHSKLDKCLLGSHKKSWNFFIYFEKLFHSLLVICFFFFAHLSAACQVNNSKFRLDFSALFFSHEFRFTPNLILIKIFIFNFCQ